MELSEKLPELSLAVIESLKEQGLSQSEIARLYGVSRQAISWWKYTYGGRLTPRQIVNQSFPFQVRSEHAQASPYRRLRDHGEYIATGGKGMTDDKLRRLRWFYRKLRDQNLVVEYDPSLPPEPGVSTAGGWAYRKRKKSDGNLLVRVNEYTEITKQGRRIWVFPKVEPFEGE